MLKSLLVIGTILLLGGCSVRPVSYESMPALSADGDCRTLLAEMERRIRFEGTRDAGTHVLKRFPYLRSDRFLASFAWQLDSEQQRLAWFERLYELGRRARTNELNNLSATFSADQRTWIESCLDRIAFESVRSAERFEQVTADARVPDEYSSASRIAGLFPLTRLVVFQRLQAWQGIWKMLFNSAEVLGASGTRYLPPQGESIDQPTVAVWLSEARQRSPLGIPKLTGAQQHRIFLRYAPVWLIEYRSDNDRIGRPYWKTRTEAGVETQDPVTYRYLTYTRFQGQVLVQLNYSIWFPARPPKRSLDIYAGRFDGLIWRVTLGLDGGVLVYDSIHSCGCYHKLYPVNRALTLRALNEQEEQPLIMDRALPYPNQLPVQLHITAVEHYLQGVTAYKQEAIGSDSNSQRPYRLAGYRDLLSLPQGGGRRSLFAEDGLLKGSERSERYLLWPMGITSAGAMRERGRHAISFTGQRHFDDPYLFDSFLLPRPGS
jgi:hypothetical protein